MIKTMAKFKNYNVVKIYLDDDEMAKVDPVIQYLSCGSPGNKTTTHYLFSPSTDSLKTPDLY